ncbi:MAG: hypothetical protein CMN21_23795 [Rubinisphaera sp.]|nr:hypothetical protein [Rubinisphaera sp.]
MEKAEMIRKNMPFLRMYSPISSRWVLSTLILLSAGCASSRMPSSFSSLVPGQGISGQYEPDVDYEAEQTAQAEPDEFE